MSDDISPEATPVVVDKGARVVIAIVVATLLLGCCLIASIMAYKATYRVLKEHPVGWTLTTDSTSTPAPLNPNGVQSWTEWLETATPVQWDALYKLTGVSREQVERWAAQEQVFKKSYQTELPAGTVITNSGSKGNSWYPVKGYKVKPGDTLFLTTDKGVVVVKVSCGNPVIIPPPSRTEEHPGKPAANPYGPPQRPGNPVYVNPPPDPPDPPVTPGYTPENAERVSEEQASQPVGGTDPTPSGTPGTGAGGFTPPGTTSGGGATEQAPPPTTAPADTPATGQTSSGDTGYVP